MSPQKRTGALTCVFASSASTVPTWPRSVLKRPHIALLVESSRAYGRELLRGVAAFSRAHGPWILHIEERSIDERPPSWLKSWSGHGIIARVGNKDMEKALVRARKLTGLAARKSPTAIAAFKHGVLDSVGNAPARRGDIEAQAYDHCVNTGQAAIGRAHFSDIREGKTPPWGPRIPLGGDDASS